MRKNKITYPIATCLMLMILLGACKKEIDTYIPGNGQEAYVNFYNSSEIIHQSSKINLAENNMIYINDSVKNEFFQREFFQFSNLRLGNRQFPKMYSNWPDVWGGPGQIAGNQVYWQPMPPADFYRFIFTSVNKVFLKEITTPLSPKSFTTLYMVESPESEDAYTIVKVPVEPKGVKGKVKIQVVNLATDWGPIDVVMMDGKENVLNTNLPQNLGFGKYSVYTELDTQDANEYKQLVLKIRQHGSENFTLITTIDAIPESTYTLVVKGFANETMRSIKTTNSENFRMQIVPNLRVQIRSFTN